MVIARFNRTLTICFSLLMIVVIAATIGFLAYMAWHGKPGAFFSTSSTGIPAFAILFALTGIPGLVRLIALAFRDWRAVWIENGALHFFESLFDDPVFLVFSRTVPLDSIAGLLPAKAASAEESAKPGIYLDLKSGKSHKVLTFLLSEPQPVVMARLREALGFTEAKADVS